MLKKQTQRKLALYFSAMILLNGFFFWRSAHGIATGLSDFSTFYTAAEILREGQGHQLYNLDLQESVQRSVTPAGVNERGAVIPYNHPPFEAPLFLPLIAFSYGVAYCIWLAVNAGLLAAVIIILRRNLHFLGQLPLYLWIAACVAFTPITFALIQGQDSIVLLFCFCMAFIALRRKTEFSAGVWIALGLFKFRLSLPFIAPSLLLKRWRAAGGFCVVALLLTLISLGTVGLATSWHYPEFVWELHHNPKFSWLAPIGTPNLRRLGFRPLPAKPSSTWGRLSSDHLRNTAGRGNRGVSGRAGCRSQTSRSCLLVNSYYFGSAQLSHFGTRPQRLILSPPIGRGKYGRRTNRVIMVKTFHIVVFADSLESPRTHSF